MEDRRKGRQTNKKTGRQIDVGKEEGNDRGEISKPKYSDLQPRKL